MRRPSGGSRLPIVLSRPAIWPWTLLVAIAATIPPASLQAATPGSQQDPDAWLRITVAVGVDGEGGADFLFAEAGLVPDTLESLARAEARSGPGSGSGALPPVEALDDGGVVLHFTPRPLGELEALLAHLPEDRSQVRMTVRIAAGVEGADMWEFQGMLSAQRIRRVRFETDGASFIRSDTRSDHRPRTRRQPRSKDTP